MTVINHQNIIVISLLNVIPELNSIGIDFYFKKYAVILKLKTSN